MYVTHDNRSTGTRTGSYETLDGALTAAASEASLPWDYSKDWKTEVHLGVNLDARKYLKYRLSKARAAISRLRRLSVTAN